MFAARLRWSREATAAAGLAVGFIALTIVWLASNRVVPVYDFGTHLTYSLVDGDLLRRGDLLGPFRVWTNYPPLGHIVGGLGSLVAGSGVDAPVIAQNLFFVPLLALGCYRVGRLVFGPTAGVLAVVYALGAPMVGELFHGPLLDAPEAAMVALAVWLLLASDRFRRPGVAVAAGVACGLGALTKQTFVLFVAGLVLALLARGGWDRRRLRGVLLFAAAAVVIAGPWYVYHRSELGGLTTGAVGSFGGGGGGGAPSAAAGSAYPPRLSLKNAGWYLWSDLNFQLLAPLVALSAVGTVWSLLRLARRRRGEDLAVPLLAGGLVSWLGISYVMPHDSRYSLPALVYLAVLGTGWIAALPRRPRLVLSVGLGLVLVANTAGASFGVGAPVVLRLPGAPLASGLRERQVTFYTTGGEPRRDGDVLGLFRALRRSGVPAVHWDGVGESIGINFTRQGLGVLADIAGLTPSIVPNYHTFGPRDAFLLRRPIGSIPVPPCLRLDAATAIWVQLGDPTRPGVRFFCPLRRPEVYG